MVTATVRPHPGRTAPMPAAEPMPEALVDPRPRKRAAKVQDAAPASATAPPAPRRTPAPKPPADPERIEPGRKRRIAREREPLGGRLDLHGMTQDQARAVLHGFIARACDDGARAVLIITGKGVQGDGILRRRVPDWLGEPPSRSRVAGYSSAERHHGGEGALYVALKRGVR